MGFLDFGKNRKTGSGVDRTGNEAETEYLKKDFNDFLQSRYENTILLIF